MRRGMKGGGVRVTISSAVSVLGEVLMIMRDVEKGGEMASAGEGMSFLSVPCGP